MQRDPTAPSQAELEAPDELLRKMTPRKMTPREMTPAERDALARLAVNRDAMADLEKRLSQWAAALDKRVAEDETPGPTAS